MRERGGGHAFAPAARTQNLKGGEGERSGVLKRGVRGVGGGEGCRGGWWGWGGSGEVDGGGVRGSGRLEGERGGIMSMRGRGGEHAFAPAARTQNLTQGGSAVKSVCTYVYQYVYI